LQVTVEKSAGEAQVSFTVPAAEFESEYNRTLNHAAKHVRVKGFRPGRVPGHMVEKTHGEEARRETIQHFLNQAYQQAVEEHELQPASHPRIDLGEVAVARGEDFNQQFQLQLRPEFELGDYRALKVEGASLDVSEEEVEGAVEDLRRQRATPEPAGEDGLPEDGMALCKCTVLFGEEEIETRENLRISPVTPMQGVEPELFKERLTGAMEGDQVEVPFTFPEGFGREELAGKDGLARIELGAPLRIVLPPDEELWKLLEAEDEEAFRDRVANEVAKIKEQQDAGRIETELLERLIEQTEMELPSGLVSEQTEARVAAMRAELAEQQLDEEQVDAQLDSQGEAARTASERGLRAMFLIEAIAKEEGLEVKQPDIVEELEGIASRNQTSLEEVRDYYQREGLFNQLVMELQERKVRAFLRENADIERPEA